MLVRVKLSEIRAVAQLPVGNYPYDAVGTVDFESRTVYLKSGTIWFPFSILPATIIHEVWHLRQHDLGILGHYQKQEWPAYMMADLFHVLHGDDLTGTDKEAYSAAYQMAQSLWPEFR